ncbi:MAG: flagellar hook-basal body complex protein FliE [Gemmatimonadetes bacterium]|nr:flagellar hook-basal body complex protein FliE [Gemmatimonadota bacterium]
MSTLPEIGGRTRPLDVGPNRLGGSPRPLPSKPERDAASANEASGFAETARRLIAEVDGAQKHADAQLTGLATGEVTDVHQVTVAVEEARLSLSLMIQIRNRLVESYQEVMRMQI